MPRLLILLLVLTGSVAAEDAARPFLHPLFSDGAVVQRDTPIRIWGWTKPGATVQVALAERKAEAVAVADGRWQVEIAPLPAGGPHVLTVTGPQAATVKDVLVGDVWLCSGQSNMEMGIEACKAGDDIAKADLPQIRLLTVPRQVSFVPVLSVPLRWRPCSPKTLKEGVWGGFSAAAFYFGRHLHQELKVPIGLVHASWGGTIAEAWTSFEGLQGQEDFKGRLEQFATAVTAWRRNGHLDYALQLEDWFRAHDPGTAQDWQKPDLDTAAWRVVEDMPKHWERAGFHDFDGVMWFRREVEVPTAWVGKDLRLSLGPLDDMDTTWFDGVRIGGRDRHDEERHYTIPGKLVTAGRHVVAIRVLDTAGQGGMAGRPEQLRLSLPTDKKTPPISLAGAWRLRDSMAKDKLPSLPARMDAGNPNVCTVLSNGMIAPLVPAVIKGAIWYQGESNAGRAWQYRSLLPALVRDWRSRFACADLPFHIVQLANWQQPGAEPRDNEWAELREAQALTAKALPTGGLAVAIDIGDANDIHPRNKAEVGRRLALSALANTYGRKLTWSGPWYRAVEAADKALRIRFDHVGAGLEARGGKLTGFAIAGEDRRFVWADAVIDGDTVLVSSPQIAKPIAVRYAWDISPVCNLFNKDGLPAVPFRTDDWPAITLNNR